MGEHGEPKGSAQKNNKAARFGIHSIPTLLYFADGELRHQTVGVVGKKTIVSKLEEIAVTA